MEAEISLALIGRGMGFQHRLGRARHHLREVREIFQSVPRAAKLFLAQPDGHSFARVQITVSQWAGLVKQLEPSRLPKPVSGPSPGRPRFTTHLSLAASPRSYHKTTITLSSVYCASEQFSELLVRNSVCRFLIVVTSIVVLLRNR